MHNLLDGAVLFSFTQKDVVDGSAKSEEADVEVSSKQIFGQSITDLVPEGAAGRSRSHPVDEGVLEGHWSS